MSCRVHLGKVLPFVGFVVSFPEVVLYMLSLVVVVATARVCQRGSIVSLKSQVVAISQPVILEETGKNRDCNEIT